MSLLTILRHGQISHRRGLIMKKRICAIFTCLLLMACVTINSSAIAMTEKETNIEYFADGSYLITTVTQEPVLTRAASNTVKGNKNHTYYNSNGGVDWVFTVTGTFSVVSGVSATCTAVSHSTDIRASKWKLASASSWKSGNQALGKVTMKQTMLGLTIQTIERTVTLTCDNYGNLT